MANQQTGPSKVYVYGQRGENSIWYCIDLESLPKRDEQLSPVAKISFARAGDWTVAGDCIYWAGGHKEVKKTLSDGTISFSFRPSKGLLRHKFTTENGPGHWEPAGPPMKFPRFDPRLFALGDGFKIFVLGGNIPSRENYCEEEIERSCGEVYNQGTKTWDFAALRVSDFADLYACGKNALVRDGKGEPNQVVFYSCARRYLLFYDVHSDAFKLEDHPNFALSPTIRELDPFAFHHVVVNVTAVVSNSTLYWFAYDLYLYGYDFVQQRWFRSRCLGKELSSWQSPDYTCGFFPFLVDLYNGEFMLFLPTPSRTLDIAILAVSKSKPNPKSKSGSTGLLDVTVKFLHTLTPSDPYFCPLNGMAI